MVCLYVILCIDFIQWPKAPEQVDRHSTGPSVDIACNGHIRDRVFAASVFTLRDFFFSGASFQILSSPRGAEAPRRSTISDFTFSDSTSPSDSSSESRVSSASETSDYSLDLLVCMRLRLFSCFFLPVCVRLCFFKWAA